MDVKTWSCPKCSLINPMEMSTCEVCYYSNEHPTIWNCFYCTFLNIQETNVCEMCSGLRNKSQKEQSLQNHTISSLCQKCQKSTSNGKSICATCERTPGGLVNSLTPRGLINSSMTLNRSLSTASKHMSLLVVERQKNDETDAEKISRAITRYCRSANIHFVDDSFPPISRSIGDDRLGAKCSQWLRIRDIAARSDDDSKFNWSVMLKDPNPADIEQGQLGDC
ncbi:unnamed protein product, partial [Didymodactylos carnosus]